MAPTPRNSEFMSVDFVPPLALVAADYLQFGAYLENPEDALRVAVETVVSPSIRMNFESGGRPPWEPLADSTMDHTKRAGTEMSPLVLTGALMDVASSMQVWNIDRQSAEMEGSRLGDQSYGLIHQEGGGHVPQREWAVMQEQDLDRIEEVFDGWLTAGVVKSGFISSALGAFGGLFRRFGG